MIFIERITWAFRRAYLKRTSHFLLLLIPVVFFLVIQITMFIGENTFLFLATVLTIIAIIIRNILLSNKSYLRRIIRAALYDLHQSDCFFKTIESEMCCTDLLTYDEKQNNIFIFVTLTWLIFVSPNGSIICRLDDITDISTELQESRYKFILKVDLYDGGAFMCAYEHIYEPLVELIKKRKGVEL